MEKYIVELLRTNSRLIIPEFGAFFVKKDEPKTIAFNEFLKFNDGIFIDYISKKENIKKDKAIEETEKFVKKIYRELEKGNHYFVENLGEFLKDEKGRIQFILSEGKDEKLKPISSEKGNDDFTLIEKSALDKDTAKEIIKEKLKSKKEKPHKEKPPEDKKKEEDLELIEDSKPPDREPKQALQKSIELEKEKKKTEAIKEIKKTSEETKEPEKTEKKPEPIKELKKTEGEAKISFKEKEETVTYDHYSGSKKSKIILWIVLGLIPIAIFIVWFVFYKNGKTVEPEQNKFSETSNVEEVLVNETVTIVEDSLKIQESQPLAQTKPESEEVTDKDADNSSAGSIVKKYYVVAGCFEIEENANNYVSYLKNKGYNPEKFGKVGKLYVVSFNSFSSKEAAIKELREIQGKIEPEAWILFN